MTPFPTCNCTLLADVFFLLFLYCDSKLCLITVPRGITYAPRYKLSAAMSAADTIYGRKSRLKLIPQANIAIISEFPANFEVKKMTAMNTNNGLNKLAKYGTKLA